MKFSVKTLASFCRNVSCSGVPYVYNRPSSKLRHSSAVMSDDMCGGTASRTSGKSNTYRSLSIQSSEFDDKPIFQPKTALILTKFSRYEFEKRRHPELNEEQLIKNVLVDIADANGRAKGIILEERGSDYKSLLHHHEIHKRNQDVVAETLHSTPSFFVKSGTDYRKLVLRTCVSLAVRVKNYSGILRKNGIETKVVNRFEYTDACIQWADVIFTTGGDGTFLMAASKVYSRDKPVIGINSDPSRDSSLLSSIGYLCLPTKYTDDFPQAIRKLKSGFFRWKWRQRIRVTLVGEHAHDPPIELHDQQLQYPEYRFLDFWQGHPPRKIEPSQQTQHHRSNERHVLPVRALNEVFVGETLSSRVSYYEISTDGMPRTKQKSSGFTACTGTGSTSWSFNISKVTPQCIQHLLKIVNEETGTEIAVHDTQLLERITSRFNNSLIFDPSKLLMAYSIRDPVIFGVDFNSKPRGFAKRIEVKSRMFDACLVIDGGLSYVFNDGALATLEIYEEDALRTVTLLD